MVDALALQAAVAEDLPGLHAGEDVLDVGPDLLVGLVVGPFPVREFLVLAAAAMGDESAATGDCRGLAGGGLHAGFGPGPAVVTVARQRAPHHDHQAGASVDNDLVVR
jgi:hypothetical protein